MADKTADELLADALGENDKYKTADDRKHEEIIQKKKEIDEYNINARYDSIVRAKRQASVLEDINLDVDAEDYKRVIIQRNTEYLENAREGGVFLDDTFRGYVPYFPKNLILIGAKSGNGKSTIAANLAYNAIRNGQRALIITNEEAEEDFYNRIICLLKGWHYTDHENFTDDQLKTFNMGIAALSQKMMVISDVWQGREGTTTTLEGLTGVFNAVKRSKQTYDVIILDYYQGLSQSLLNPGMADWQVQQEMATYLNGFVKTYPHGPVIVLSQLKEGDETFKNRVEGRKSIYNRASCAVEVKPNFDLRCTEFEFHKARHNQAVGKALRMGYNKGMFVPYNDDFKMKVMMDKQKRTTADALKDIKPGDLNGQKSNGSDEKKD